MSGIDDSDRSEAVGQRREVRHILAIENKSSRRVISLESSTYSIGRDSQNSIILDGPSVSRQHAILLRVPINGTDRYMFRLIDGNLKGNRSKNGTYVNGKSILTCKLRTGDKIRFGGDFEAEYHIASNLLDLEFQNYLGGSTDILELQDRSAARDSFQDSGDAEGSDTSSADSRETLSDQSLEADVDVTLARLASFPELIPNPIVEFDLLGTITYANPAALNQFPDLAEQGINHTLLLNIPSLVQEQESTHFVREVRFDEKVYEQSIHFFSESDLVRTFAIEVTDKERAKQALKTAEDKYRNIFETAIEGIYQVSAGGKILTANPALARILGYDSPKQLITEIEDIARQVYVDPDRRSIIEEHINTHGSVSDFRSLVFRRDGKRIWVSENSRVSQSSDSGGLVYEGSVVDITERMESERELRERNHLLSVVAKVANLLLGDSDIHVVFPQSLSMLGQALGIEHICIYENSDRPDSPSAGFGFHYEWTQRKAIASDEREDILSGLSYTDFAISDWHSKLASGKAVAGIVRELPAAERNLLVQRSVQSFLLVPVFVENYFWGLVAFFEYSCERYWPDSTISAAFTLAASISGVIRRKRQEESIRKQALHDPLTKLPSRQLFEEQLGHLLSSSERRNEIVAVLFLDLDDFKFINDTFGHPQGDALLREVARRLLSQVRAGDVVARWGGDEFTVLLPRIQNVAEIKKVVGRILGAFKYPFIDGEREIHTNASIGIAMSPQDGRDTATLIKHADIALYQAKESGKNVFRFYNHQAREGFSGVVGVSEDLYSSLKKNQLVVYYQPIVSPAEGKIVAVEALLRWNHPQSGLMTPSKFLPAAEKTGLIIPIGEWVMHTVLDQLSEWQTRGLSPISVALNLSVQQLVQNSFRRTLEEKIDILGMNPNVVSLEITETAAFKEIPEVEHTFKDLSSAGIRLSIDDFGSGYSSFSRLQKLPLHTLKTDRTLVQNIVKSSRERNIIEAILDLGKNLGLEVIVEGVEEREQLQVLSTMNCEMIQGYVFYRPMPASEITSLLEEQSKNL